MRFFYCINAIILIAESFLSAAINEGGKGDSMVRMAIAHLHDQNQEQAFAVFLEALDAAGKSGKPPSIDLREEKLYAEALDLYLHHPGTPDPHEIADKILSAYGPESAQHPEYFLLNFVVALAKANAGNYEEFFTLFYSSYERYPEHYLAYKTKAVLHLKLMERGRTAREREDERAAVLINAGKAIEKNGNDAGLYKLMMLFASDDKKGEAVDVYLNKIVDESILIPRSDIAFFVKQAVEAGKKDLAQRFLDKTKKWYQYSKVVNAAQEYLDKQK